MLLHRRLGQPKVERADLLARVELFRAGRWLELLAASSAGIASACQRQGATARPQADDLERRAARAHALVRLGEVSAARQALLSEPLAPGTAETLAELRDPERRPQQPHGELEPELLRLQPQEPLQLDRALFLANLRGSRRGAAPGPNGATAEHFKVALDDESCFASLCEAAQELAQGTAPPEAVAALRLGRLVALKKPNGKVRGIVSGDVFRRLVARTLAQQLATDFESACAPFQYALSTRAGAECVAHALRAATELDPSATVLSIDGIGAFDHVSRQAMLSELAKLPVRLFYGSSSEYLWYDGEGVAHTVNQAEGGEQGDPLMPALFSLGQHPALKAVQEQLLPGEAVFAFLGRQAGPIGPQGPHPAFAGSGGRLGLP
jgi:hypothetical protein